MGSLRDALAEPGRFVVAAELVTSRGPITSERGAKVLALARDLAADPRIDVLSITDNPGGHAMLSPDALGTDLISRGQEVIIHLACKDWNRNALESRGWQLSSGGFHNVLALSGDYPVVGHRGLAAPVFDIDSVGLISLFSEMNAGLPDERRPDTPLQRTDFFLGGVVTNHKRHEREVMPQYFKLRKKARAGARFVINQAGWNTRKDDELLRWIRRDGLDLHVLANVYLLSRTAARAFHRGVIPGIVVTDELLALAERHAASPDNGRAFFVDLASKHLAVVRGLGYDGVYLGGHMPAETFGEIIDGAERLRRRLARARTRDPVSAHGRVPLLRARSGYRSLVGRRQRAPTSSRSDDDEPTCPYPSSTDSAAVSTTPSSPATRRSSRPDGTSIDASTRRHGAVRRAAHALEQAAKVPLFDCKDCGDCSLPEIAYVCPESQCAKNQRNGPCGGTRDGLCEVYDTECIWSEAYERLKAYGEEESMLDGPVVVKDNALQGTSAWANTFLGRDHQARADLGSSTAIGQRGDTST